MPAPHNFLGVVGAVFRERREGTSWRATESIQTPAIDLRRQTDSIEDRTVIQAKFLERSTSDFFNRIGH